jgi:AcrR family transcriptional regulator
MGEIQQIRRTQLTEALLSITATRGLDRVSVREVASVAGVSIGTVQHYFATKDQMLLFAFRQVVERTRARVAGIDAGAGPRRALGAALRELLPLDQARLAECRVYLAFAARAATSPALAAVQQETLSAIHADLQQVLSAAATARPRGRAPDTVVEARLLLAVVDGLMFDAVSAPGTLTPADLEAALDVYLDRLLPAGDHPAATE